MDDSPADSLTEPTVRSFTMSRRVWTFAIVCAAAALVAGGYTTFAVRRNARVASSTGSAALLTARPERPSLMFRSTASDSTWKKLMLVPLRAPGGAAYQTPLECERAYFAGTR